VPDVLLLGQFPLSMIVVLGLFGGTAAYLLSGWLARLAGQSPDAARDAVLDLLVGTLAGAKLIYVLLDLRSYIANPAALILFPYGPLALPGGLAGGALALFWSLRRKPERLAILDQIAGPVLLAAAIGGAGWHAPGSLAFAPALALAAVAAISVARFQQTLPPGVRAAITLLFAAVALALADLARPGGKVSTLQWAAAVIGTLAWLWVNRTWKKDSGT
jgi:prolipoprotein diacylglyceryltransferase